jgi:hypothetical protein
MTLKDIFRQNLAAQLSEVDMQVATMIAEEFAIKFHLWMLANDTQENAEQFFGFTDEDMMNVFKQQTGL